MQKRKNKWLAAILNALLPGLGYLYVGSKRRFFSVGLLVVSIVFLFSPTLWSGELGRDAPIAISSLLAGIVFAVDAWKDAVETYATTG